MQFFSDHETIWNYAFNLVYGLPFFLASVWLFFACRRWRGQHHRDTIAIFFLGFGQLMYGMAQAVWTYYNLQLNIEIPTPSVSDYFYGSASILEVLGLGILLFHTNRKKPHPRWQGVLGILCAIAASFLATPFLFLLPEDSVFFNLDAFYTGASILTIFLALLNMHRQWHQELRPFFFVFFLAAIFSGFGDLVFALNTSADTYWNGDLSDGLFAFSGLLYLLCTVRFLPRDLFHTKDAHAEVGFFRLEMILPLGVMVFGLLLSGQAAEFVYTRGIEPVAIQALVPDGISPIRAVEGAYVSALIVFLTFALLLVALSIIVYLLLSQRLLLQEQLSRRTEVLQSKILELERYKFYLDRVSEVVVAFDERGRVAYANHAALDMFGLKKDPLGMTRRALLTKIGAVLGEDPEAAFTRCDRFEKEIPYRRNDGSAGDLLATFVALNDRKDICAGMLMVSRDITERKNVERTKTQFVSMASHQMRSPMTQLRWLVEQALGETRLTRLARERLLDMQGIVLAENKFVHDLLNASRIERGVLKVDLAEVLLKDILKEVMRPLEKDAQDAGVRFEVALPTEPISVSVDREKIVEAIRNVVHNAVKFSPHGSVVRLVAGEKDGAVGLAIIDQGPGIPKELWKQLYDIKIVAAGDPKSGAGLGLYLTKKFVEAVGGSLAFESSPKGTTFFIRLPLAKKPRRRYAKKRTDQKTT